MKKLVAVIISIVLLTGIGVAAAPVPSISTGDTTQEHGTVSSLGVEVESNFLLAPTEASEVIQDEIQRMYTFVNGAKAKQPPAQYFPEDVRQSIEAKLPEILSVDNLVVNEIVPLIIANYDTEYGDVITLFTCATQYDITKTVVILLGLIDDKDQIEWVAVNAYANVDGGISVIFPQNVLLLMGKAADIMMVVFSEP